jgi:hypothetical protein
MLPQGGVNGRANGEMTVISRGGAFIETSAESRQGNTVQLSFALPPGRVRCTGIVRDCAREGVGVEFTEVAESDAERIRAFVELAGPGDDNSRDQRRSQHGERTMQKDSVATKAAPSTAKKEESRPAAIITPVYYDAPPAARPEPAPAGPVKSPAERPQSETHAEEGAGRVQEFELQLFGALNNNIRRPARLTGTMLGSGSGAKVDGEAAQYTLFFTRGANLVVHIRSGQGSAVEVFRSFDDFREAVENRDDGEYRLAFGNVLPAVAKIMGADFTLWID